jgi:hypothetical protein
MPDFGRVRREGSRQKGRVLEAARSVLIPCSRGSFLVLPKVVQIKKNQNCLGG